MDWLKTSENLDKLKDHYFYLVTHPDFGTPLKAKYHDDLGGYFEFPYYPVDMEFVNPIFGKCVCKYFMEMPDMPEDYTEDYWETLIERGVLVPCDPDKNTGCTKENCYINGGDCSYTKQKEFIKEEKQ